jgi:hypothetical protein
LKKPLSSLPFQTELVRRKQNAFSAAIGNECDVQAEEKHNLFNWGAIEWLNEREL